MLVKRLFATTTGAIVSKGAAILTALLLFRQLPTAEVGRYTAALTLVGFCAILANAGLNPLTTREIARRGAAGRAWWATLAPLRLLLALAAYALLALIAILFPALVDTRLALVAGLLLVPDALAAMLAATLTGLGRAALASWLDALNNWIGLLATLALLLLWHAGVLALAWLAVMLPGWALLVTGLALARGWRIPSTPANNVIFQKDQDRPGRGLAVESRALLTFGHQARLRGLRRNVPWLNRTGRRGGRRYKESGRTAGGVWRQALAAALPLGLGALAATLYFRVDTLFLSAAHGGRAVAYYSAPYQIVESFWLISTSWNAVALPALARQYSPRFVEHSVSLLLCIGLPASLLIAFRAEDVARLVFGPAYLPAALPLRLVIWVVPILFGYVPVVTALFVHDQQRLVLYVLLANLALALLLDALLIPPYGALGASVATLIVEAGGLAGYLWLARRARLGIVWMRGLWRPALLCVPLLALLAFGQSFPFSLILALTVLAWAALFGLLRPWTEFWHAAGSRAAPPESAALQVQTLAAPATVPARLDGSPEPPARAADSPSISSSYSQEVVSR
jgi:O-antigen/teichoic acid export membrane protein